ncbi:MAG: hydrogenase nickel incorporation protein HypB [Rhodoferax sp.]|jgi:hydrogenase nickel incorporation protein HypB|uniref:hydrogenase nickel incorporation protein HypB n=1 Tax=Rhodoferax sp. TaxID=50421 RepID=UPI001B66A91B|nr:hydrogenase nickel incorporation protein HypB [Rhodoferax sp.]MBP9150440.1 hydrogenase nickel incorporation protein HypB [Rhodoferax sp.]MBP9735559.1 hydrogenase nickel incorporation protein HypB [Rhodoferax sp.]
MCVVCGCGNTADASGTPGVTVQPGTGDLHFGAGAAKVSVPGMSQERAIKLEADVLGANNAIAAQNRAHFASHGVTAYNLVSSPGSGKTTLLCATIEALRQRQPELAVAVIEGDQQTSFDADRIRATGAPAIQVNTGKGCHLDAPMVAQAFSRLDLHASGHHHDHGGHGHVHSHPHEHAHEKQALLFIENVGNLVCPAMWDLGEKAKVAILSVTEGEDKPLKYPDMFAASKLMVLNKIDLLPHVSFNVTRCKEFAHRVNPGIEILELSATTGQGMGAWLDWLLAEPSAAAAVNADPVAARIAALEAELAQLRALPA